VAQFTPQPPFPWSPKQASFPVAAAPALGAPAPEVTVVPGPGEEAGDAGRRRHVRLRIISPRGAPAATLVIPESAGLQSVRVGEAAPQGTPRAQLGWYRVGLLALPPEGMEVDLVLSAAGPVDAYVTDRSYGLPPSGDALKKARPASAVPIQDGDVTVVSRKIKI
jgi:hypothetical protein